MPEHSSELLLNHSYFSFLENQSKFRVAIKFQIFKSHTSDDV